MRVLITGVSGFVGSHLADYLLENHDVEIYGIIRWRSKRDTIYHLENKIKFYECDLRDLSSTTAIIKEVKPDRIFHLAAQSFVPASWNAPAESLTTNILGNLNLLEAVRYAKIDPLIQVACSSEEYGLVLPNEVPIKETNPLRPLSPYAVSKVGQEMLSYQYFKSYGIKSVITRGFNHTGPRRGDVFVCSNFAKQIAQIELGLKPPVIEVGNLSAKRDFTDVRDMVRAYWLALEKGIPGEVYNICSGTCYTIRELLDKFLALSNKNVDIVVDKARLRPSDVEILLGDNTKFRKQTGWRPEIPFEKTLEDILNYWRERLGNSALVGIAMAHG